MDHLLPYIPYKSEAKKKAVLNLVREIKHAVTSSLPIGFFYHESARLVLPHSIYIQDGTRGETKKIRIPGTHKKMPVSRPGGRKCLGMIGFQEIKVGWRTSEREVWRDYHIDKIDNQRLLTLQEIQEIFALSNTKLSPYLDLTHGFTPIESFVRHWDYPWKKPLRESPSKYDLIPKLSQRWDDKRYYDWE